MTRTAASQARAAHLFIVLPLALITTFVAAPCLVGIALSLFQYDAIAPSRFVGLDNYRLLAADPLIATTMFLTIMGVIGGFQVFQSVYIMTAGGPLDSTRVIIYYLWQNGFEFLRMGYASAIAVLVFVIILALTLLQWRLYGSRVEV